MVEPSYHQHQSQYQRDQQNYQHQHQQMQHQHQQMQQQQQQQQYQPHQQHLFSPQPTQNGQPTQNSPIYPKDMQQQPYQHHQQVTPKSSLESRYHNPHGSANPAPSAVRKITFANKFSQDAAAAHGRSTERTDPQGCPSKLPEDVGAAAAMTGCADCVVVGPHSADMRVGNGMLLQDGGGAAFGMDDVNNDSLSVRTVLFSRWQQAPPNNLPVGMDGSNNDSLSV
jgi:hypothetical protein